MQTSCNSSTVSGPSGKECTQTRDQVDMTCTEWPELVFHRVDEDWQMVACAIVSVPFMRSEHTLAGDATVVLRHPHHTQTIKLFCSFSYLITGQLLLHACLSLSFTSGPRVLKVMSNTYKQLA